MGNSFAKLSRVVRALLFAVALAAAAAAGAGCGSDGDGTIPSDLADGLVARVDAVEQSVQAGDCDLAEQQAAELVIEVQALPAEVDTEVRDGLLAGSAQLSELTTTQCEQTTGATGTQETEPVEPETPEKEPPPEEEKPEEEQPEGPSEEQPSEDEDGGDEEPPPPPPPPPSGPPPAPPSDDGEDGGSGGTTPDTGGVISPDQNP